MENDIFIELDEDYIKFAIKCLIACGIFWACGLVFNLVTSIVLIKLL